MKKFVKIEKNKNIVSLKISNNMMSVKNLALYESVMCLLNVQKSVFLASK